MPRCGGAVSATFASQFPACNLDGQARFALVRVAQDVCKCFVDGTDDGARLVGLKMKKLRRSFQGSSNQTKSFGIALQVQFDQQFRFGNLA